MEEEEEEEEEDRPGRSDDRTTIQKQSLRKTISNVDIFLNASGR